MLKIKVKKVNYLTKFIVITIVDFFPEKNNSLIITCVQWVVDSIYIIAHCVDWVIYFLDTQ